MLRLLCGQQAFDHQYPETLHSTCAFILGDMSFKRPSDKAPKGSLDSTTSSSGTNAHSQRSSFAMERASLDANRSSLEMFASMPPQQRASVEAGYQNLEAACRQMGIPKSMCKRYMLHCKQTGVDQQQLSPMQAEHVFSMAVAALLFSCISNVVHW